MNQDSHIVLITKSRYHGTTQIPESFCYIQLRISPTIRRVSLHSFDTVKCNLKSEGLPNFVNISLSGSVLVSTIEYGFIQNHSKYDVAKLLEIGCNDNFQPLVWKKNHMKPVHNVGLTNITLNVIFQRVLKLFLVYLPANIYSI